MFAEFESKPIDFRPTPSISLQAVEIEEAVLGAILLDPGAIAEVENLPVQAFSISNHRQIFKVMLDLHRQNLQPDLPTVALKMSELDILISSGGKSKLASLLDRTVHSCCIKQYVRLLKQKYYRRYLVDSFSQIARLAESSEDLGKALLEAQSQLQKIQTVTGDSLNNGDTPSVDTAKLSTTVTSVTRILEKGLPDWEEQANLDALQSESGISKASFAHLVASLRCQFDEVMPQDEQQLGQLISWKNAGLNFKNVLPHLASDLLHDAGVLNIDPVMLWQYLLPTTLSFVGKKVDLDVGSHKVSAIAWTCCVAESGTGKSRAEGLILSPLKAWQEEEHQRFKSEWEEYKQSQNKKDDSNEPFVPPVAERKFLFEVATIQAVMRRLSEQGSNGSLWARDEIAGLFKSLSQFTAKGEGEGLECLLPMWDGTSAAVDRVLHEDSYYLASTRLGIAGGIQPGVFRKIFTDPDDAQGLQARFLFALPKVQPAKRVKGYCRLSGFLPDFYGWVDTQFPAGTLKLSHAADARYDAVYEDIGRQAESAETPAIRAWMRKLPGQLLRIALALHIIECYHELGRPRHEIQLDTLDRAVDLCRYYRSVFQVVQQSVSDSDSISSILLKIWDMAATSPSGLAVRDAYRSIKALPRRAKELGRNVAAYVIDLYSQLEKMGKGTVQRCGRLVRFVAGVANAPTTPLCGGADPVTVVTVPKAEAEQASPVSPINEASPVTAQDFAQLDTVTDKIHVLDLSTQVDSATTSENSPPAKTLSKSTGPSHPDYSSAPTDIPKQGPVDLDRPVVAAFKDPEPAATTELPGCCGGLLNEEKIAAWHEHMNACQTFDDTLKFFTELDKLSLKQRQQFESSVPEDSWTMLLNLPSDQEQEPELEPALQESEQQPAVLEPDQQPVKQPTLDSLKALLTACDSLVQLRELKRKHSKTIAIAYNSMNQEEQARVDALAALSVPHKVFKYMGDEIRQGTERLIKGTLVYLDPQAQVRSSSYSAEVWAIDGVSSGWKRPINVSFSLIKEVVKAIKPSQEDGGQQMGLI